MKFDLEFQRRVSQIPFLGMGLSVDVYTPDLCELMDALECDGLSCGYLEIFEASHQALRKIRSQFPSMFLNYHAEGMWVSQPDWESAYPVREIFHTTADHLRVLGSYWLNQECASKQMVGYSFGTYLPPLFSEASAAITAKNAEFAQRELDARLADVAVRQPLLLMETPPLTYFGFGDLSYPEFFRCLTDFCSCGLVLDIGHLWTVFRYSGAWRHCSIQGFLDTFLQAFPLDRVIQIHLAGLDRHPMAGSEKPLCGSNRSDSHCVPDWIDSHGARIPEVLWEMLDRVLKSRRLVNLKGIALEVDTKPIEVIAEEFARFQKQFEWWAKSQRSRETESVQPERERFNRPKRESLKKGNMVRTLVGEYKKYVGAVTGGSNPHLKSLEENPEESERHIKKYVYEYLPYEVMVWGGDLRDMFPQTIQRLVEQKIDLSTFVVRWYSEPRPVQEMYDFFLLKIDYFVEFVNRTCPSLNELVSQEAKGLREGYTLANDYA